MEYYLAFKKDGMSSSKMPHIKKTNLCDSACKKYLEQENPQTEWRAEPTGGAGRGTWGMSGPGAEFQLGHEDLWRGRGDSHPTPCHSRALRRPRWTFYVMFILPQF